MSLVKKVLSKISAIVNLSQAKKEKAAFKEISRVVKPGGHFLLLTDTHEEPTVREPQVFSWDVVKKFILPFQLLDEKYYEKSEASRGMYEGILANVPFDHSNHSGRYGILSAKFIKK